MLLRIRLLRAGTQISPWGSVSFSGNEMQITPLGLQMATARFPLPEDIREAPMQEVHLDRDNTAYVVLSYDSSSILGGFRFWRTGVMSAMVMRDGDVPISLKRVTLNPSGQGVVMLTHGGDIFTLSAQFEGSGDEADPGTLTFDLSNPNQAGSVNDFVFGRTKEDSYHILALVGTENTIHVLDVGEEPFTAYEISRPRNFTLGSRVRIFSTYNPRAATLILNRSQANKAGGCLPETLDDLSGN